MRHPASTMEYPTNAMEFSSNTMKYPANAAHQTTAKCPRPVSGAAGTRPLPHSWMARVTGATLLLLLGAWGAPTAHTPEVTAAATPIPSTARILSVTPSTSTDAVSESVSESGPESTLESAPENGPETVPESVPASGPRRIQIAILLDTSGSMSGLISQAQARLWTIVNRIGGEVEPSGALPLLEVALYEYGKSSLAAQDGFLRQVLPLTTDLDALSAELFALATNGGDEYCGWVIHDAVHGLGWSDGENDLRTIFIAGNEPFDQGTVDYRQACSEAIERGILVNTIHCGSHADGVSGLWADAARLADGRYLHIDHNQQLVHIEAPQDEEITLLNARLNETYLPYGAAGISHRQRQEEVDSHTHELAPAVAAERTVFKASSQYRNAEWDLVDAVDEGRVHLGEIDKSALPEALRDLSEAELTQLVRRQADQRIEIQQRIRRLDQERQAYVAEQKRQLGTSDQTLDAAMLAAIDAMLAGSDE